MDKVPVDIQQDSPVKLLVDNMGLKDLVVEGLRGAVGCGHVGSLCYRVCALFMLLEQDDGFVQGSK